MNRMFINHQVILLVSSEVVKTQQEISSRVKLLDSVREEKRREERKQKKACFYLRESIKYWYRHSSLSSFVLVARWLIREVRNISGYPWCP